MPSYSSFLRALVVKRSFCPQESITRESSSFVTIRADILLCSAPEVICVMPPITVHDVLRLALPPGTTVVAGGAGLLHQVTWVATPRATLPAFVNLRGGELALISVAAVQALDDRLTLANLVERLAPVPISAIAVLGE